MILICLQQNMFIIPEKNIEAKNASVNRPLIVLGSSNKNLLGLRVAGACQLIQYRFYDSCGKAAKDEGYRYFCIEFYGECWGYKDFNVNQSHAGANACWGKRPNYDTCIHNQRSPICVGTGNHGYIYELS